MDLEIAIVAARDGDAAGLVAAMTERGNACLLATPGCRSVKVLQGVENPGNVLFMVEWESVEAHDAARGTDSFRAFLGVAGPWFSGSAGGSMQHFKLD